MARLIISRERSKIYSIYSALAPEFNPLIVHSNLPANEQTNAIDKLRSRQSRVIVCVDMLGEGFDLPQLKIAALHDIHKSLAVTIQFIGRFIVLQWGSVQLLLLQMLQMLKWRKH